MFCYQCEQTAKGTGCTVAGACGKDPQTAALQDLLIYATKDISRYAYRAHQMGTRDRAVDVFTVKALFSTITNVNFDLRWFGTFLQEAAIIKGKAQSLYEKAARQALKMVPRPSPVRSAGGRIRMTSKVCSPSAGRFDRQVDREARYACRPARADRLRPQRPPPMSTTPRSSARTIPSFMPTSTACSTT